MCTGQWSMYSHCHELRYGESPTQLATTSILHHEEMGSHLPARARRDALGGSTGFLYPDCTSGVFRQVLILHSHAHVKPIHEHQQPQLTRDAQPHYACRMMQQEAPLVAVLVIFLCDFTERLSGQRKEIIISSSGFRCRFVGHT